MGWLLRGIFLVSIGARWYEAAALSTASSCVVTSIGVDDQSEEWLAFSTEFAVELFIRGGGCNGAVYPARYVSCDDLTDTVWAAVLYCGVSAVLWCSVCTTTVFTQHTTAAHTAASLRAVSLATASFAVESVVTGAARRLAVLLISLLRLSTLVMGLCVC